MKKENENIGLLYYCILLPISTSLHDHGGKLFGKIMTNLGNLVGMYSSGLPYYSYLSLYAH
jgi:hypothetical protein